MHIFKVNQADPSISRNPQRDEQETKWTDSTLRDFTGRRYFLGRLDKWPNSEDRNSDYSENGNNRYPTGDSRRNYRKVS
jgi:hypothetical protein